MNEPYNQCVHSLFEEQVARTPHAPAVIFGDQHFTYQEINQRANRLAHYLQTQGVGPESRVGICLERSLEMVIGLLGILKAGGAYVPLDPTYPGERISFMLRDAHISVLLTQKSLLSSLSEHRVLVICLDVNHMKLWEQSASNPIGSVHSTNLAYIIYTSGSTGVPKGVAMPHRSLSNLLLWQIQNSTLRTGAKTLQFTSLSFDVSFQEIFSTWCAGGILVIISNDIRRDPICLLQFLQRTKVARLFLPFVALQQMTEAAENHSIVLPDLREVITAGEQLQITPGIRKFFKNMKQCILQNQYGPSESHVVTFFTLIDSPDSWPTLPPIGRPIANAQIYVLDAHRQPVPIGISGEMYIGGICLAREYLNHPELTREKFITNPFDTSSRTLLYKTGDLARYLPDGNVEFLGRIDHQVKIRGYRVELGEIEAILSEHPEVGEAVVITRERKSGEKALAACVIPHQSSSVSPRELHHFLKNRLPEYMVPSFFAFLEAFPLTLSGKVDRRVLATEIHFVGLTTSEIRTSPQTLLEKILADIWESVFEVKQIGIQENFFELGGDSLIATRILSRIERSLQVEVPLQVLFDTPTIENLAVAIEHILTDEIDGVSEE